ncbi:MAG: cytochrome C oxidase subunit IV family protein [Bacteroidota bacterium]
MGHLTYEESKKVVFKGLILLGVVTIVEVVIALLANGHVVSSIDIGDGWMRYPYMLIMIGLSIYKAYFIVYEFMHMRYEVKGLVASVILPMGLLVWAIVAFFNEGASYGERRNVVKERNKQQVEATYRVKDIGSMDDEVKTLKE